MLERLGREVCGRIDGVGGRRLPEKEILYCIVEVDLLDFCSSTSPNIRVSLRTSFSFWWVTSIK